MAHGALQEPTLDRKPDLCAVSLQNNRRIGGHRRGPPGGFGGQQHLGIWVLWPVKNLCCRPGFDDGTILHHADPVGDLAHDGQVVGDEQHRHAGIAFQIGQQIEDLRLNGHVQCGRRLIRDQQVRPVGQRHRDHHPLPLPAGELMRIRFQAVLRIANANAIQQFDDPRLDLRPAQALMQFDAFSQLLFDRVQRVQRCHRLLEDEADIVAADPAQGRTICAHHLFALVFDRPGHNRAVTQQLHR